MNAQSSSVIYSPPPPPTQAEEARGGRSCQRTGTASRAVGLINYIDTKANWCHPKNWAVKGLWCRCLSEFMDWRYSQSRWYFRPSFVNCCLSNLLSGSQPVYRVLHIRMRPSLVRMRSSLVRMRSSLVVRASDCQCTSCNGPGFDPSIRRHSGIWGAADEAVLNIVRKKREKIPQKIFFLKEYCSSPLFHIFYMITVGNSTGCGR